MIKIFNQFMDEFGDKYEKSGLKYPKQDYLQGTIIISSGIFIVSIIGLGIIHYYLLNLNLLKLITPVFFLSLSFALLGTISMFIFPIYKANQMTNEIDSGLIYTVSYMTVLATSGISIEEILERVAEVEDNPSIKKVASRFVADIKLFGKDLEQALVAITEHSSSVLISKLMDRIMNTVWSSGDLKSLLEYESERLLQLKHEQMKKTLNSLTYLGEIYVAMMIVAPILFIIMFSLLSVIGGNASNTSILLNLIVFLGLPVVASMFLIILDTMIGADW